MATQPSRETYISNCIITTVVPKTAGKKNARYPLGYIPVEPVPDLGDPKTPPASTTSRVAL